MSLYPISDENVFEERVNSAHPPMKEKLNSEPAKQRFSSDRPYLGSNLFGDPKNHASHQIPIISPQISHQLQPSPITSDAVPLIDLQKRKSAILRSPLQKRSGYRIESPELRGHRTGKPLTSPLMQPAKPKVSRMRHIDALQVSHFQLRD